MMPKKVPADFNAGWYVATYPDVAMSGLDPREHYLRFGRLMGRASNGVLRGRTPLEGRSSDSSPAQTAAAPEARIDAEPVLGPQECPPIIDRPSGFDPAQAVPLLAPAASQRASNKTVSVEALAQGPFLSFDCRDEALGPLVAYARMFGLHPMVETGDLEAPLSCGATAFQAGETRFENAWFADSSKLRLMVAGATQARSDPERWVLRAYQADPASPGEFMPLGPAVQLPALGPVFHDLQLVQPLMPLLLELADPEGLTRTFALMPFPSLLPGGLHWAELKALQIEANPMDDFWSRSDLLLRETVGHADWPARSITRVAFAAGPMGAKPWSDMQQWMAALFGLGPQKHRRRSDITAANVLTVRSATDGLELTLPSDCIPTIGALVSRSLDLRGAERFGGPYLVAEAGSFRPLWSVVLPAADELPANVPAARPVTAGIDQKGCANPASIHLAIALRQIKAPSFPKAPNSDASAAALETGEPRPLTVVIDSSDASRTRALLEAIGEVIAHKSFQFLVRLANVDDQIRAEFDRILGRNTWSAIPSDADLRDVARDAQHPMLLTISDQVRLQDSDTLPMLCSLLDRDSDTASASCALLGERIIKRQAVLEPASGGLFPAGISFLVGPRLAFAEPDVLEALPDLDYPVVANTLHLTVFRTSALAALPRPVGPVPATAADIRLGLDLMNAGHRNWCTTRVMAGLSGDYQRRDVIDPMGGDYLQPGRWEGILGRVTLLRALS